MRITSIMHRVVAGAVGPAVLACGGALVVLLGAASCGSSTSTTGSDGGATGVHEAGADGAIVIPPADAPFACGTTECRVDQYCLHPCCGGAPPECLPRDDGGPCPSGTHANGGFCGNDACEADPCTPPAPSCIDDPNGGVPGGTCEPIADTRVVSCACE